MATRLAGAGGVGHALADKHITDGPAGWRRPCGFQPAFSAAALMTAMSRAVLQIAQPEFDRIHILVQREFIHEGFDANVGLRSTGIAQVGRPQRRGSIEQRAMVEDALRFDSNA